MHYPRNSDYEENNQYHFSAWVTSEFKRVTQKLFHDKSKAVVFYKKIIRFLSSVINVLKVMQIKKCILGFYPQFFMQYLLFEQNVQQYLTYLYKL